MKSARYPIRPCIANRFRLVDAADESIGQPADSSRDASRRSRNLSALHPSKGRPESLRRHPPAREPRHRAKPMSRICRARSSHRNTGNEPATVALDNAGHRSFWHLPRAAFRLEGEAWLTACAAAWGRGAAAAFDLHLDPTRRATALRAAHLRRPGKDAAAIIAALLTEDALTAQAGAEASDRAARRLFDRLTSLGLVRELTGRPTFRLYGL